MAEPAKTGQLDLEKELTCSICTEVLYQPLTLLDCLHTFCGSCLKFWFQWQAAQNKDPRKNPYTCPSCRASVRTTSSDAKINTLLEMFLLANPGKGRTEEEKKDIDRKYTRSEDVIPKRERARTGTDEVDRRMVEEAREMSLRDANERSHHGYERGVRHRHRSRDRGQTSGSGATESARSAAESLSHARHIEHQSSLRSLISTDEVNSAEMEEEILRQIAEEGLLDGIDLHTMDTSQLDELSERIAEAYRRRHDRGTQSPRHRHTSSPRTTLSPPEPSPRGNGSSSGRRHGRSTSATGESARPSNPPVSHRQLLVGADGTGHMHRRRRSSESRRQTSPNPRTTPVYQQAARSATELSANRRVSENRERRPVELNTHDRRNTDPRPRSRRSSDGSGRRRRDGPASISPRHNLSFGQAVNQQAPLEIDNRRPSASAPEVVEPRATSSGTSARANSNQVTPQPQAAQSGSGPTTSSSPNARGRPQTYPEPSVTCDRCGKPDLQYELHEHCSICNDGKYNLCHRCFREGKGCLNWHGFGERAWHHFQRGTRQDPPHPLIGRQYLHPHPASIQQPISNTSPMLTTEDPTKRLLSGAFCSICTSYADDCFWHCTFCNDSEWGYCNNCVNAGKCCNHPLLPIAHISAASSQTAFPSTHPSASFAPLTSPAMKHTYPASNIAAAGQYQPLTFSTACDICHYPVQPSQSRYHCYVCNGGNYDICNLCYSKLVGSGRIAAEDGDKGWRRCIKGHRMIKFFFEDTPAGQRRVIVNDLVGGLFLEEANETGRRGEWSWMESNGTRKTKSLSRRLFDDDPASASSGSGSRSVVGASLPPSSSSTVSVSGSAVGAGAGGSSAGGVMMQKFPPDGGAGMRCRAMYAWIPAEAAKDELSFPRGAEIREVAEASPEWFEGSYAGTKGLFPINYVIDLVPM